MWGLSRRLLIVFVLAAVCLIAHGADSVPPLSIAFDSTRVTAGGASPGAKVVVVGYERRRHHHVPSFVRHRASLVADPGGAAIMKPHDGVSADSIWIAVDVQTGRFGAAVPGGGAAREIPLRSGSLKKDNVGQLRKFVSRLPRTYLLLVRPGAGAWDIIAGDGGRDDDDTAADGKIEIATAAMKPLRGFTEGAPKNFRKGDLLIGLAPDQLAYFVVRVEN